MPEWSIVISGTKGSVTFNPDPLEVSSGDLVSWSNRTQAKHTIVIDDQPKVKPMTADSYESTKPAYKVTAAVTYTCDDDPNQRGSITIKTAVLLLAILTGIFAPSLQAQLTCADLIGGELKNPPEISATSRGTLVTTGEKQLIAFLKGARVSGAIAPTNLNCVEQWVRTYRKDPPPEPSQQPNTPATLPQPGPTIRARVGDLVQLTFLNLIDPLNFPGTDTGECDQVQGNTGPVYPQTDKYPNCFHGSVFTNVHFHGTHTSPNTTADNVFLEIVPSPRTKDDRRTPAVTADSVKAEFAKFYGDCEARLNRNDSPQLWPRIWNDLPEAYRKTQDDLLINNQKTLYLNNQEAISSGAFPQNYIGAFPYCFRLPVYTPIAFPPPPPTEHDRPLMMGQSPGTHWYHAHKHGSTTLNVSNGMTGVMVIEGDYDRDIKSFYGNAIQEKVLILNQIGVTPRREGGTEPSPGPYFSVNGRLQPTITIKRGEVQMWRIANTSSRSGLLFKLPAGVTWRQLSQDGVQFTTDNYKSSENQAFVLASGNRADLLVRADASATLGNSALTVVQTIDPATDLKTPQILLYAKIVSSTTPAMEFIDQIKNPPPYLTDIKDSEITGRKSIVFDTTRDATSPNFTNHTIDGKKFDGDVGALVLLNQVEEWTVSNKTTNIAHPFHIHINPFQVTEEFAPNDVLQVVPGTGTVSLPASSATLTGSGFSSFRPGWVLNITGPGRVTVLSVQSDTSLTLTKANGTTAYPNASYTVNVPRYVFATEPPPLLTGQCYVNPNDPATWKPCAAAQLPATQRIWWDVLSIPTAISVTWTGATAVNIPGYFKMRSRFVDYPGYFVIHCHILSHEDRGMMTVVSVAPLRPPFKHH
jgi:FtsP/CotA-like multicopper oxidase with cupredoxin domain